MRIATGSRIATASRLAIASSAIVTMVPITACGERVGGPTEHVGQLRVQPAFAAGAAPGELGVTVETLRVRVVRTSSGAVHGDTTMPWDGAAALSWVLALESESDVVNVAMLLLGGADTLYAGLRQVNVQAGTIGSAPLESVGVSFLGALVDHVVVEPGSALLVDAGTTRQLTATAFAADGSAIPGRAFTWTSANPAVAAVDGTGTVVAKSYGLTDVSAATGGAIGSAAVTVAVRDSVTTSFSENIISEGTVESSLGAFSVPAHVPELGFVVRADVLLSGDDQRDEAFAIGVVGPDEVSFVGDPACPVVPDDPTVQRGWVDVGAAAIEAGVEELVARHAVEFPCYQPVGGWGQTNSVHFYGLRFVYYRVE